MRKIIMLSILEKMLWTIIIIIAFITCLAFHTSLSVEELYEMFREDLADTWNEEEQNDR
jgi:hypothetical protein